MWTYDRKVKRKMEAMRMEWVWARERKEGKRKYINRLSTYCQWEESYNMYKV